LTGLNARPYLSSHRQTRANADQEEPVMTSFTFSLEQLKAAPPEVRRWVEHEIGAALGALSRFDHDPSQVHSIALAACTPEEALQMFELIKDNFVLSQVFFELARETPAGRTAPPLYALNIAELLRLTRLSDGDRLADCFTAINQIFQNVRRDPEAALFGFDQYGHVYIHETTHHSVRRVWEQLFATDQNSANRSAPLGVTLPHLGPSEDIAGHAPSPPRAGNPSL
jgi:hypothetical protein